MQVVPPQLESFPATCRECHKGKRLIFNQNMYYIFMLYVCMVCSCIICSIMSETLPTQTHFDRMCQQLCTYYVHIMCVCACVSVHSVQTKGLVKPRTGLGPIYEIFGLRYRVRACTRARSYLRFRFRYNISNLQKINK